MTVVQYATNLIKNNWSETRPGRDHSVPEPFITRSKEVSQKRLRTQDVVQVIDGGSVSVDPLGLGYTHEERTSRVSIVIRTTESRERFEGHRDANNEAESWGGLIGEVDYILRSVRKGDKEFDVVVGTEFNDNSENFGKGYWRGSWEVELDNKVVDVNI